jgi:caffeoyl-CoA O-methyltransferase
MANRTLKLTDRLYDYVLRTSLREPQVMRRLRAATARLPERRMQTAPEEAQFLGLLVEIAGAKRILEVGTFTGYSALAMALALPKGGRLIACDVSERFTAIARRFWKKAGVAGKITLELGPALATLDRLIAGGEAGTFDLAFIDADKTNYRKYYERALRLLRPGGLVAIDNVLWGGSVADARVRDADTRAIRALNRKLLSDRRVSLSLLPIADGLTLARKR